MPFSTTQLARKLDREARDVFALLSAKGWIVREGKQWRLTPKGEFEGGCYTNHEKYGEYIVWPEKIMDHRVFSSDDPQLLSVTQLAKPYGYSPKGMNFILSEMGWIRRHHHGWALTEAGQIAGGLQAENENTGAPYTQWPESIRQHAHFRTAIQCLTESVKEGKCLDGHVHNSVGKARIDNWLYCAGVAHSCHRVISNADGSTELISDFYLPEAGVCIVYWGGSSAPAELGNKVLQKEKYKELGLGPD